MFRKAFVMAIFSMFATCGQQGAGIVCTPVKQYSQATRDKAADELEEVKKQYPAVTQLLADYASMRAAARACAEGKS